MWNAPVTLTSLHTFEQCGFSRFATTCAGQIERVSVASRTTSLGPITSGWHGRIDSLLDNRVILLWPDSRTGAPALFSPSLQQSSQRF